MPLKEIFLGVTTLITKGCQRSNRTMDEIEL